MQVRAPRPVPAALSRAAMLSVVALLALGPRDGRSEPTKGTRTYEPVTPPATGPSLAGGGAPVVPALSKPIPGKLIVVAPTAASPSGRPRFALVMANGAYARPADPLPEAHDDAWRMADALAASGFTVFVLEDATEQQMNLALVELADRAKGTRGVEAALVYYAGHGAKLPNDQDVVSVLVPIDAKGSTEAQLAATSVPLALVQEKLVSTKAEVLIAVIDACRDNPFLAGWVAYSQGQSRALSGIGGPQALRGGVQAPPAKGVGVSLTWAFAQQPGLRARDGLYTPALAARLRTGCGELNSVFDDVSAQVRVQSGEKQAPERTVTSSGQRFVFRDDGSCPPTDGEWRRHTEEKARLQIKNDELNRQLVEAQQAIENERRQRQQAEAALSRIERTSRPEAGQSVAAWSYTGATVIGGAGIALLANGVTKRMEIKSGLTDGTLSAEAAAASATEANRSLVAGYAGIGLGVSIALGARFIWTADTAGGTAHIGLRGTW
jgi:hypothetical protein